MNESGAKSRRPSVEVIYTHRHVAALSDTIRSGFKLYSEITEFRTSTKAGAEAVMTGRRITALVKGQKKKNTNPYFGFWI